MDLLKAIRKFVSHGTVSYLIYNPFKDYYDFTVDEKDFISLFEQYRNDGIDFEVRIHVADDKTKIVLI